MVYFSPAGGSGGGLADVVGTLASTQYDKKSMVGVEVWTDENISNSVVEPYNLVLAVQTLIDYFDMHIVMSNQNIAELL